MSILDRRIGRKGFAVLLGLATAMLLLALKPWSDAPVPPDEGARQWGAVLLYVAFDYVISAWRCHDFGQSGWHDFWTNQVPFVGGFLSLYEMFFKAGDPHFNAWGPPPAW